MTSLGKVSFGASITGVSKARRQSEKYKKSITNMVDETNDAVNQNTNLTNSLRETELQAIDTRKALSEMNSEKSGGGGGDGGILPGGGGGSIIPGAGFVDDYLLGSGIKSIVSKLIGGLGLKSIGSRILGALVSSTGSAILAGIIGGLSITTLMEKFGIFDEIDDLAGKFEDKFPNVARKLDNFFTATGIKALFGTISEGVRGFAQGFLEEEGIVSSLIAGVKKGVSDEGATLKKEGLQFLASTPIGGFGIKMTSKIQDVKKKFNKTLKSINEEAATAPGKFTQKNPLQSQTQKGKVNIPNNIRNDLTTPKTEKKENKLNIKNQEININIDKGENLDEEEIADRAAEKVNEKQRNDLGRRK